jgi:hypothetical protein
MAAGAAQAAPPLAKYKLVFLGKLNMFGFDEQMCMPCHTKVPQHSMDESFVPFYLYLSSTLCLN